MQTIYIYVFTRFAWTVLISVNPFVSSDEANDIDMMEDAGEDQQLPTEETATGQLMGTLLARAQEEFLATNANTASNIREVKESLYIFKDPL